MKRDDFRQPFLVGVTGGIGSGKSTVCRFLSEMGCALFEADKVAREQQETNPDIIAGMRDLFGFDVFSEHASGTLKLDRRRVAAEVFINSKKLQALNALVHPRVYEAFESARRQAARQGVAVLVKEAAILFETGRTGDLDLIVVVAADTELRVRRAEAKGLGSREEILRRIAAQWPQEKLIEMAGYVIRNNGSLDELRKETEKLYAFIMRRISAIDR
ncbi:MAG: dephospho-CoA kinase [Chlorobium sp.]|jgi:dephospho-CoA kinase|uniref:dephospho-CoA kinase n=1 Tax=Chlorobium sp. TaxID=1095 RepID=UPI001DDA7593|nr:dephospho-CoA kinase [Chlorobium sp.]MBN1279546.1 dephospho-CoA kinase [Chlorobiaceae bacterium]MCF8215839.1 dephospho-CoA kinase [Chlorobium sp.]MCF8270737.1 dephospho-CoA kinase [Chlorobium sp.]MCF8287049.1 dephospho-CoA kinase [Chlorobium sp.]MCF8290706.1 dephospho-CoA kinase [Chlorobium sp.]